MAKSVVGWGIASFEDCTETIAKAEQNYIVADSSAGRYRASAESASEEIRVSISFPHLPAL